MKYISRKRLEEYKKLKIPTHLDELIAECTELDELTVTKLRPMSEAKHDSTRILGFINNEFVKISSYDKYWSDGDDDYISDDEIEGWIPMPQYKPEE